PGLRVGWVTAPPAILDRLAALKADGGTSPFLQRVAALVLARGGIAEHIAEVVPELVRHRDAMVRGIRTLLPDARITVPDGGYFVWAEFPEGVDGDRLARSALDHGVVVYPGSSCFAEGPRRNTLRLSYSQAGVAEIEEGMKRLAGAYREMGGR
ncbi:MAG: aminotransferase class I/II-fold pyridoxal phosphate-dependent enzyme, partial [Alphaproteobacteria bacterium]|nr:aminotransferase class I/II-fold pyridoxal phosphate-dependent enzyme [Alphaproteobacteria bacterium]